MHLIERWRFTIHETVGKMHNIWCKDPVLSWKKLRENGVANLDQILEDGWVL